MPIDLPNTNIYISINFLIAGCRGFHSYQLQVLSSDWVALGYIPSTLGIFSHQQTGLRHQSKSRDQEPNTYVLCCSHLVVDIPIMSNPTRASDTRLTSALSTTPVLGENTVYPTYLIDMMLYSKYRYLGKPPRSIGIGKRINSRDLMVELRGW